MRSRADLHIHSKYSNRPQAWILRRFNVPESFVEPLDLHRRCKERGMDFVTITDHDSIAGGLEIAHLPDVFLSTQISAKFPDNGAKVHLLLLGVTEQQFQEAYRRRDNIFDVQRYCLDESLIHVVAHALDRVDDQLTVEQFEKLALLFERFEVVDGAYNARSGRIVKTILENLTPEIVARLAEKHHIEPAGREPWKKCFTGGSHDYSGVHSACAFTSTPAVKSVGEFLARLRAGDHEAAGESGSSLRTAHRWYRLAYEFYKSRFMGGTSVRSELFGEMFRRMLESPQGQTGPSLRDTAFGFVTWLATSYHKTGLNATEALLVDECSRLFGEHQAAGFTNRNESQEQRLFHLACQISDQIGGRFFRELMQRVKEGRFLDAAQTF
ncbi:MAG TPA: PHP domain-containing protein, partial [Pirellulales bacterium]